MQTEPKGQIQDLAAIHHFYTSLLERELGFAPPVPEAVEEALREPDSPAPYLRVVQRWLSLLDLAVTPPMVRDALKGSAQLEAARSLLRYYSRKTSNVDNDRDKADCVVSLLFREFISGSTADHVELEHRFEQHLAQLFGAPPPDLPDDRRRLVREFEYLRNEVEDFRHFDALMDSGIMQRVRGLKQSLQESFYHPGALAAIASYNNFFGARFDDLFRQAATQIKRFATKVQSEGASVATRLDGDVTVEHLAQVEEEKALTLEYGRAQESFQTISRLKKVVDKRTPARPAQAAAASPFPDFQPAAAPMQQKSADAGPAAAQLEQGKLTAELEKIAACVRVAPPKGPAAVPMSFGSLMLSPAESDAFRSEYRGEKSFRGEYADKMAQLVALYARMGVELKEMRSKKGASQFLWKPHAEALSWLLSGANSEVNAAERLCQIAQQRGLTDKVAAMTASVDRLRSQMRLVTQALQE